MKHSSPFQLRFIHFTKEQLTTISDFLKFVSDEEKLVYPTNITW